MVDPLCLMAAHHYGLFTLQGEIHDTRLKITWIVACIAISVAAGRKKVKLRHRRSSCHCRNRGPVEALFEESFHAGQNVRTFLGLIHGLAQGAAVGHTVSEPGDELLHLAGRAVAVFCDQHAEIGTDHLEAVGFRRIIVTSGIAVLANLAEDPRIRRSSTADHDGVAPGLLHYGDRIFRRADITIADHRNGYGIFDRGNPLPAGIAALALLAPAGVQGYGLQAARLAHAR